MQTVFRRAKVTLMRLRHWMSILLGSSAAFMAAGFLFFWGDLLIVGNGTDRPIVLKKVSVNGATVKFTDRSTEQLLLPSSSQSAYEHAAWLSYKTVENKVKLELELQAEMNGKFEIRRCTYQRTNLLHCTVNITISGKGDLVCSSCDMDF